MFKITFNIIQYVNKLPWSQPTIYFDSTAIQIFGLKKIWSKTFFVENFFGWKKLWSKKFFGWKNFVVEKNFWLEKFIG